jgi:L-alanine-DL-glutamate epimerase-like enolase superfamily enzyme
MFADVAWVPYAKTVPDVNGAVEVPDRPGLGADPELDMMEKFKV